MNTNRQEITRLAGFVGGAMTLAGYVRHSIQDLWGWFNLSLVAVGLALLLASIALNFGAIADYFRGRSGRLSANMALITVAVVGLIAIGNFLGYRHHKRFDLTTEGLYTLSGQTRNVLANLDKLQKDVKIVKFAPSDDQQLADQMSEFKYVSNRISYERVDEQEKPGVASRYAAHNGETIAASGDRVERLQQTDEQSLVNAIIKVTRDKLKRVCFTEGHDEKSLNATEGDGYARVDGVLKNENHEVKAINLATSTIVPAECDVLIAAGPKKSFLAEEAKMIGVYLDGGGKVFLLLDPNTDPQLGDVLKAWNVVLGNDTIVAGRGGGANALTPVVIDYAQHPITKDMRRSQTLFPGARSVKTGDAAKGEMMFTEILKTLGGDTTWAKPSIKGDSIEFDPATDKKGPISLGVAVSKKVGDKEARLVVIGDSEFAANGPIRFVANGDLFFNTVNWLAQDEDLISIRPKSTTNRSLTMNPAQQSMLWWLIVVLIPLAAVGAGGYIWWKRR